MDGGDVNATRWSYFRRGLPSRFNVYALLLGVAVCLAIAALAQSPTIVLVGPAVVAAILVISTWQSAGADAATDFFRTLAPELGLEYVAGGALPPLTPLLSAGDSQELEHVMEGPLFGAQGGPLCTLGHYEFKTIQPSGEGGQRTIAHPFTIAAVEIDEALPVFHGVYLRRRPRIHIPGFLWDDWLARAHAEQVDLESSGFEELYELRAARDQDRTVLHELFSPSFIVWLTEHPLRPGFECKAGELVVFIPEHEGNAGRLRLFHEAAREVGRRVIAAIDDARSATPAA